MRTHQTTRLVDSTVHQSVIMSQEFIDQVDSGSESPCSDSESSHDWEDKAIQFRAQEAITEEEMHRVQNDNIFSEYSTDNNDDSDYILETELKEDLNDSDDVDNDIDIYDNIKNKKSLSKKKKKQFWFEATKLGSIHVQHMKNAIEPRSISRGKTRPNVVFLKQCYQRLPSQLKTMKSKYSHHIYNKQGYLNPTQFLWTFLDRMGLLKDVPTYTNNRMKKKQTEKPNNKSYKKWKQIERCIFVICIIIKLEMGFTGKTSNKRYWDSTGRGVPKIIDAITRDIFLLIFPHITTYECRCEKKSSNILGNLCRKRTY